MASFASKLYSASHWWILAMVRDLVFSRQERMEQEAIIDSLLEINYGGHLRIVRMRYILNLYIMT
uniref:Uncharacterized protein n=1 Tax=Brassica oleracea var. oleracea TaxID=109376 RepID=A0A0D3CHH6_BRAOL